MPFCALSKLYLMLYRGYFSVLQTVNCSFAFLETYFCTWLILPPLVLHISIDLPFPETDHVNPTRICLEFAGFLFRHSTQLCCNWGDASKSMCRYTALFMKYAGHYSQEYHEWKGSFVDWLRSFFYRDRLWLRLCFMWEWNVGKLHLSSLGLE